MTKRVALVFRTIGERTSDLSLELAKEHIRPDEIHILDHCKPFSETVNRMIAIDWKADVVVALDADSLILEDMRPFLEVNDRPYVDCYVYDRFRGRLHCGVHITRVDVMNKMKEIEPPIDDLAYVLRPESRMRKLALNALGYPKCFKGFRILHDHFQWLRDVWAKYSLRELRSRTPEQRRKLDAALVRWEASDAVDMRVAREAVNWAQKTVPEGTDTAVIRQTIARLPEMGASQIEALGIDELEPLTKSDVLEFGRSHARRWPSRTERYPVFGLGLSRTGTRSLTAALHVLGVDTIHYPIDEDSFRAVATGKLDFSLLRAFDGVTDITVSPYFAQLDEKYPDAKFVLTVRDEETWLPSCANHWRGRDAFETPTSEGREIHMRIRRLLRASTYGIYDFEPKRFRAVYRAHVAAVRQHFAGRPDKLLELNVVAGDGWEPLCQFLERPLPDQPFPHKGGKLTARLRAEVGDPDD